MKTITLTRRFCCQSMSSSLKLSNLFLFLTLQKYNLIDKCEFPVATPRCLTTVSASNWNFELWHL